MEPTRTRESELDDVNHLPQKPMLLPYAFHLRSKYGPVFIMIPGRNIQLRLPKSFASIVDQVLELADGARTIPQLIDEVKVREPGSSPEMVIATLDFLQNRGVLIDGASTPPRELDEKSLNRWGRNLSFFSGFETAEHTRYDYQLALSTASVALLGLGGIGSWVAYNLAMAGVGSIVGVDAGTVALNNLNRQVLYRPSDVGKLKVEAAAEALAAVAPTMGFAGVKRRLQSEQDVAELIEGSDIVILTADQPPGLIAQWTNAACFALRIPYIECGLQVARARVGPLYIPGVTGCWACEDVNKRRHSKVYAEMSDRLVEHNQQFQPSFATVCSLAGSLIAQEACKYLSGFVRPALVGCEATINTLNLRIKWRKIKQQLDCPICHVPAAEMPHRATLMPPGPSRTIWARLGRFLRSD